jgi:hypothetical protein
MFVSLYNVTTKVPVKYKGSCQYAVVKGKLVLSSTLTRCRQWGEFEFEISNFKTKFGQVPIALGTANTQAQTHKETLNL